MVAAMLQEEAVRTKEIDLVVDPKDAFGSPRHVHDDEPISAAWIGLLPNPGAPPAAATPCLGHPRFRRPGRALRRGGGQGQLRPQLSGLLHSYLSRGQPARN